MLAHRLPDPHPASSTSAPSGQSTRAASHWNQGSSDREYFACSAMRTLRLLGSLYCDSRRYC